MRLFPRFLTSLLLCFLVNSIYVFGQKPLHKPPRPVAHSQQEEFIIESYSGNIDGRSYVDLGLSVKWAAYNIGASSPEDYGNYFAWGETTTKKEYTTKSSKTYGVKMNNISGDVRFDAARYNWGGGWRLPTQSEIKELVNNCTFRWINYKGVFGSLIKSKRNENCIFLPAAGTLYGMSKGSSIGECCYYWSSVSSDESFNCGAYEFVYVKNNTYWSLWAYRNNGNSIRPVHD